MAKAMRDAMGVELVSGHVSAEFGRDLMFGGPRKNIAYWKDPAFQKYAGRTVKLVDADDAQIEIKKLHAEGSGAFVKATDLKLFALPVPVGTSFYDAVGDYMYSVIDRGPCIMVQPLCNVRFEMRFVSVSRRIVTCSTVAWHVTPLSRVPVGMLYETPDSTAPTRADAYFRDMKTLAGKVAMECEQKNVVIDCAIINGRPAVIEFNPFSIGNFGLYNCDPHAIAEAYAKTAL